MLDLVLPPRCAGCSRALTERRALCTACDRALARIDRSACPACQDAAPAPGMRCEACASGSGVLDACCAAVWFEGAAASYVRRFKYAGPRLAGFDPGAEAVALALVREAAALVPGPLPDALVPVPLHAARVRARGFTPSAVLARSLARALGAPPLGALLRVRDTPSQTWLDRPGRRRNVAGAFAPARAVPGCTVWLVDDVVTTGATLGEAARVLREAGARRVAAVCVARTPAPPG
ncbi:MAG TPA: ComF family protein [Myxococcota bacterium]|nr:ComF family protein [Myxococcota bacterium]